MHDSLRASLETLRGRLFSERVVYFPIRHHSPACALHVGRLIRARRPSHVLVEAPKSFEAFMPHLLAPDCKLPVALYTIFREPVPDQDQPRRHAAYYPFCAHSPEYEAMVAAREVGAEVHFIDLEFPEMMLSDPRRASLQEGAAPLTLASDPHLLHSEYVRRLSAQLGCRDHDELWDHLFEARALALSTERFVDELAAYCALARQSYDPSYLAADDTHVREARMAAHVRAALAEAAGSVLVVTGGFHTAVLPELVQASLPEPAAPSYPEDAAETWLIRYGFERLDRFSGYAAGMPSPAYYDRTWGALAAGDAKALEAMGADLLVEIARDIRSSGVTSPSSTAEAIAAVVQARNLADLRGHAWPLRQDLLDAVDSCYAKSEADLDPAHRFAAERFVGDRVGEVPSGIGVPPIVADLGRAAEALGVSLTAHPKHLGLDLYRSRRDRLRSRLLHQLRLLGVPLGRLDAGPDFVRGHGLTLMQERWTVAWSPMVDAALIDAAPLGETIEAAAHTALRRRIATLSSEAAARSATAATALLVEACQLGLHQTLDSISAAVERGVAEDPELHSVAQAATQLELLLVSREPLEAGPLLQVPALIAAAYRRACRLIPDAARCPDELLEPTLEAFGALRELLAGAPDDVESQRAELDPALFYGALQAILRAPATETRAAPAGAAAALLHAAGHLDDPGLLRVVLGYVAGAQVEISSACEVLQGVIRVSREVVWQVDGLVEALTDQLTSWNDEAFRRALPALRRAFSALTPRETVQVAGSVTRHLGTEGLGPLVDTRFDEQDLEVGLALEAVARAALDADGLGGDGR